MQFNTLESSEAALSFNEFESNVKSSLEVIDNFINAQGFNVSNEILSDNANTAWVRTEASVNKSILNLKKYNEIILLGTKRLAEELNMLANVSDAIKAKKPYKAELTIPKPIRFTINGKFDPLNVRPILSEFQNILDFNDKILFRYSETVRDLLSSVEFDEKFLDKFNVDLKAFHAKSWLKGLVKVEGDERFSEQSTVYKGNTFNANRAIYYNGPSDDISSDFDSNHNKWSVVSSVLSAIRFKCLRDVTVDLPKDESITIKVSSVTHIKQRCNIISGMLERLLSRSNNIHRHLDDLEKIVKLCSTIHDKADKLVIDKESNENKPFPSENRVFLESLVLLRNSIRMTFDYYNVLGMFIKILGSLSSICNKELKSYSEPLSNPENREESERK